MNLAKKLQAWREVGIDEVADLCDQSALGERVIALEQGRLVAAGSPLEVLNAPRTEAIAGWMGLENIFDARVTAIHERQGTMLCRVGDDARTGPELEVPLVPVMAAVANAVHNALGLRFYSLPMSPPKVSEVLDAPTAQAAE